MLKQRIITGFILAIMAIVVLFLVPMSYFIAAISIMMLLAAWEWSQLAGFKTPTAKVMYVILIAVSLCVVSYLPTVPVLMLASLWWLLALYWITQYPKQTKAWSSVGVRSVMGILVLAPSWLAINTIRASQSGAATLFFMFLLIWAADIGAYFSGSRWGKTKLMPKVSPGKSWQGFFGGFIVSLLVAMIGVYCLPIHFASWIELLVVVVLVNIYSVTGDLLESMLKRLNKVKDSGRLLPGHGGILDRLDSMTAAAPIFLLGLLYFYK